MNVIPKNLAALPVFLLLFTSLALAQPNPVGNVALRVTSEVVAPGDTVCVDISGSNMASLVGMQFSLSWDAVAFEFVGVDSFGLPGMLVSDFGFDFTGGGQLTFLYLLPDQAAMPADSRLFSLCLRATGAVGAVSEVAFANTPTDIELVAEVAGRAMEVTNNSFLGGLVTITPDGMGSPFSIGVQENNLINCENGTGARIVATGLGGQAPYAFEWRDNTDQVVSATETLETNQAGEYTLTVRDAGGMDLSGVFTVVTSDLMLGAATIIDATCSEAADGSIELAPSAGFGDYSYQWPDDASDTVLLSGLSPGAYAATVTDQLGCSMTQENIVGAGLSDLAVADTVITAASCPEATDGSITLTVSGGSGSYAYLWSNGADAADNPGLSAGDYSVTVTDSLGCSIVEQYAVAAGVSDLAVTDTLITDASCGAGSDGSIALTVSGGSGTYTYLWSDGATEALNQGLTPGGYTVTVTDAGGCSIVEAYSVSAGISDLSVALDSIADASCASGNDGAITVVGSGGTGAYTYAWSNGAAGATASELTPGDYRVTVTDEAGCNVDTAYQVGAGVSDLEVTDTIRSVASCLSASDGGLTVTVSGGAGPYTYAWSNGATSAANLGLTPGDYGLTVTDAAGCTIEEQYTVEASDGFSVEATIVEPLCGGSNGTILLDLEEDEARYSLNWSNGATTANISGLSPGIYSVTITDTLSTCTVEESFDLSWEPLSAEMSYRCQLGDNDEVMSFAAVNAAGGTAPYTFRWSTGFEETAPVRSVVPVPGAGTYAVTITDATGCPAALTVEVPVCGIDNEPALVLTLLPDTIPAGEMVCVDLQVDGFIDIEDLRFSIGWNPLQLEFMDAVGVAISNTDFQLVPGSGTVAFDLRDRDEGLTLDDGDILLQLCFRATGMAGTAAVIFGDTPRRRLAYNSTGNVLGLRTVDGSIDITALPGTPGISLGPLQQVFPGDPVCLPVTIDSFLLVDSMQFRLRWDEALLLYDSVAAFNLTGLDTLDFNEQATDDGRLGLEWSAGAGQSVTLEAPTEIFTACFTALDTFGISEVTFASAPGNVEVFSAGVLQPVRLSGSSVAVSRLVWPGDTDLDGVVTQYDLLPVGLAFAAEGPQREEASLDWKPQRAAEWAYGVPATGLNFKYADTDGDGAVAASDTMALALNWGRSTSPGRRPAPALSPSGAGPALFVRPEGTAPGALASFDIVLGEAGQAAETVYGLAFVIAYDSLAIVAENVSVDVTGSWLGSTGAGLLALSRNLPGAHRIAVAMTRTDLDERSGTGAIARLLLPMIDTIPGDSSSYALPFSIEAVQLIDADGNLLAVQPESTVAILESSSSINDPAIAGRITVYPNPAMSTVNIDAGNLLVERIDLLRADGSLAGRWPASPQLELGALPAGTYWLRILTKEGVAVKPLVVVR